MMMETQRSVALFGRGGKVEMFARQSVCLICQVSLVVSLLSLVEFDRP